MSKEIIQSLARQQVNAVKPFMGMMMLSPDDQAAYLRALLVGLDDILVDLEEERRERRGRSRNNNGDRHFDDRGGEQRRERDY